MALAQILGWVETLILWHCCSPVWCSCIFESLSSGMLLDCLGLSGLPGAETTPIKELLIRMQRHPKEIRAGLQRSLRKGWNQGPKCSRAPVSTPASPLSPSDFLCV